MNTSELIALYEQACAANPALFDAPRGELSAEETAGALVREHGLKVALELARSRVDSEPPSFAFELRVWQNLLEAAGDFRLARVAC